MRDLRNKRGDCPIFGFVFIEWFRPRGYWCFGFKSFNKLLKAGAVRSNWQRERESITIMRYWSLYHARPLVLVRRRVVQVI